MDHDHRALSRRTVRFATLNASLNRGIQGALVADPSTPDNVQARNAAETIQRVDHVLDHRLVWQGVRGA